MVRGRVGLEPVSQSEYEAFVDAQIEEFAHEKVRAGHWRAEDARDLSRHAVESFLPKDGSRPGHRVWKVVAAQGARVGWIWVGPPPIQALAVPSKRWLYQITIEASERGRGYGRAALAAVEALLAGEGVRELYLHVFRWNVVARSLYDSSGYEVVEDSDTETGMRKTLGRKER